MLCNPNHKITLTARAKNQDTELLKITKPFKCCCPALLPCCQKDILIERQGSESKVIGHAIQPCFAGFYQPRIDVYDGPGGQLKGKVVGPNCCIGGCCSSKWYFYDTKGEEDVKIKRDGFAEVGLARSNFTTADKYEVTFEDPTHTVDDKLRLISTVIFVDYLFFEGETNTIINCINFCTCPPKVFCPPQIWCKLCDFYCCGALIPFRMKCCIDDALKVGKMAATGV